jgi:uncharacterized protein (DUF1697 family)
MPRYVALLRAINVGGHVVEMKRLQGLFVDLGFDDVQTFIASGNVVFSSPRGTPGAMEKKIAAHLEKVLGYGVATFVRTPVELGAILAHRAFPKSLAGSTLYIGLLGTKPDAAATRQVAALAAPGNEFALHDRSLYWRSTLGMGRNPISGARLEKALGQPTTLRRVTTVEKLAAKFG